MSGSARGGAAQSRRRNLHLLLLDLGEDSRKGRRVESGSLNGRGGLVDGADVVEGVLRGDLGEETRAVYLLDVHVSCTIPLGMHFRDSMK